MDYIFMFVSMLTLFNIGSTAVVDIDSGNIDTVLSSHELVFVNFYADWCRFSRMLAPIFSQASDEAGKQFPGAGQVALARVDCDKHPDVAQRFNVNKYPTMKLFRNGALTKREYRAQRSVDGIVGFIREQMKDPVHHFSTTDEMEDFEATKRSVIGYFGTKDTKEYQHFENLAKALKDDCNFYAGFGEVSQKERLSGDNVIFRPTGGDPDMVYLGSLVNYDLLKAWATDKCVPLVREITFQNGEELTEEGLPFLILFHKKEDTESLELYQKVISRNIIDQKSRVNFLEADCDTFSHPLHHLGKTPKDCPLIAIDSFKHMYLFPNFADLDVPGKLRSFLDDLHSGKLHREFHHGPDTTPGDPQKSAQPQENVVSPSQGKVTVIKEETKTTPPESIFKNLKPSEHRYTVLGRDRDEL